MRGPSGDRWEWGWVVWSSGLVRAVESRGAHARHGGHGALEGRFEGVGQQVPRGVNLETGTDLRPFPPGWSGSDLLVLLGGEVLVLGDDAFDRLGVLIPEQKICSQLEVLCRVEGDKMDVVQRGDAVWHLVAADLPGCQVKLYRLLLIHIAQQFEAGSRLARSRREQKVFGTHGARQRAGRKLRPPPLLPPKPGQP